MRAAHKALLLALLACLLLQGAVLRAHVHIASAAQPAAAGGEALGASAAGGEKAPAPCALCVEASLSGHYLQPAPPALLAPPRHVAGVDPGSLAEFRRLGRSHGWHSRAPPQ